MAAEPKQRIALIEASLGGARGNSRVLADRAHAALAGSARIDRLVLANRPGFVRHQKALERASGFVFCTGTYWDSWSSHLQRFLEEATPHEATSLWLGKPAIVLVTEHSVGGKGVVSRLSGVLSTFGCLLPPMGGLVISKAAMLARPADPDFFGLPDVDIACANLLAALHRAPYRAWSVDRRDATRRWLP